MIKKFLGPLWRSLRGLFHEAKRLRSLAPNFFEQQPLPDEPLARFLYARKNEMAGGRVKKKAFMPRNGETSVFRVIALSRRKVRLLSASVRSDKQPKGVGVLKAGEVFRVNLNIHPDNAPERHANIISWPNAKEDQMELAQELANASILEEYA